MRPPRFRVPTLMGAVLLVAAMLGATRTWVMYSRAAVYRHNRDVYKNLEILALVVARNSEAKGDNDLAKSRRNAAAWYVRGQAIYGHLAEHPWERPPTEFEVIR